MWKTKEADSKWKQTCYIARHSPSFTWPWGKQFKFKKLSKYIHIYPKYETVFVVQFHLSFILSLSTDPGCKGQPRPGHASQTFRDEEDFWVLQHWLFSQ